MALSNDYLLLYKYEHMKIRSQLEGNLWTISILLEVIEMVNWCLQARNDSTKHSAKDIYNNMQQLLVLHTATNVVVRGS